MQSIQKIVDKAVSQKTCSVHQMTTSNATTSSHSSDHKRIDLLFSKFAAFYGHIWRSQFKDEVFFKFAKKEWVDALSGSQITY